MEVGFLVIADSLGVEEAEFERHIAETKVVQDELSEKVGHLLQKDVEIASLQDAVASKVTALALKDEEARFAHDQLATMALRLTEKEREIARLQTTVAGTAAELAGHRQECTLVQGELNTKAAELVHEQAQVKKLETAASANAMLLEEQDKELRRVQGESVAKESELAQKQVEVASLCKLISATRDSDAVESTDGCTDTNTLPPEAGTGTSALASTSRKTSPDFREAEVFSSFTATIMAIFAVLAIVIAATEALIVDQGEVSQFHEGLPALSDGLIDKDNEISDLGTGNFRQSSGTPPPEGNARSVTFRTFPVLCTDHVRGDKVRGRYFNFDVAQVAAILGKDLGKKGKHVSLWHPRTGRVSKAVLWPFSNGGTLGDGHGRWLDSAKQFRVGDDIVILRFPDAIASDK